MAYSCRLTLAAHRVSHHCVTASRQSTRRDIGAWTAGALLLPARAVAALPSGDRVPLFVITTADGSTPLFTDADGTRASFFAERRDAEAKLKSLKGAGDATVMSCRSPRRSTSRSSPPPSSAASSFSARKGERDDASAIAGAQADPDDLPLFFDPRLAAPSGEAPCSSKKTARDSRGPAAGGIQSSAKTATRLTTDVRARSRGASRAARNSSSRVVRNSNLGSSSASPPRTRV